MDVREMGEEGRRLARLARAEADEGNDERGV